MCSNKIKWIYLTNIFYITDDPFRFYVLDYASHTNGDALLFQMLSYDFIARHGKIIGHIKESTEFDNLLQQ